MHRLKASSMELSDDLTLPQFRREMQHRVVKYRLNSRPVREALLFAKRHPDPQFYRVATDKINAQRQFQREVNGPGKLELLVDLLRAGSLREVLLTLALVVAACVAIEYVRAPARSAGAAASIDLDRLARRLGYDLESAPSVSRRPTDGAASRAAPLAADPSQRAPVAAASPAAAPGAEAGLEEQIVERLRQALGDSHSSEEIKAALNELLMSGEFVDQLAAKIQRQSSAKVP
jgi:hypothetical protein